MLHVRELNRAIALVRARQLRRLPRLPAVGCPPDGQRPVPHLAGRPVCDGPGQQPAVVRVDEHGIQVIDPKTGARAGRGFGRARIRRCRCIGLLTGRAAYGDASLHPRPAAVARDVEVRAALEPRGLRVDAAEHVEGRRQVRGVARMRRGRVECQRRHDQQGDDRRGREEARLAKHPRHDENAVAAPVADGLQYVERGDATSQRVRGSVRRAHQLLDVGPKPLLQLLVVHRDSSRATRSSCIEWWSRDFTVPSAMPIRCAISSTVRSAQNRRITTIR